MQEPCLICRPKHDDQGDSQKQIKLQMVSLDGLLDYQLDDDDFEVRSLTSVHTSQGYVRIIPKGLPPDS
jgi:hypothetical protein